MSVRPGVCKPRSTTTKKDTGADCTACPDCVHCSTTGGEATVKRGYARQPASSTSDELPDSRQQSDSELTRQISIFKCQEDHACVGSNASVSRAAAPGEECKEGFGGVICSSCQPGYYPKEKGGSKDCRICSVEDKGTQIALWCGVAVLSLLLLLLFSLWLGNSCCQMLLAACQ